MPCDLVQSVLRDVSTAIQIVIIPPSSTFPLFVAVATRTCCCCLLRPLSSWYYCFDVAVSLSSGLHYCDPNAWFRWNDLNKKYCFKFSFGSNFKVQGCVYIECKYMQQQQHHILITSYCTFIIWEKEWSIY